MGVGGLDWCWALSTLLWLKLELRLLWRNNPRWLLTECVCGCLCMFISTSIYAWSIQLQISIYCSLNGLCGNGANWNLFLFINVCPRCINGQQPFKKMCSNSHKLIEWQIEIIQVALGHSDWHSSMYKGLNVLMSSKRQFNMRLSIKPLAFWLLTVGSHVPLRDTNTLPILYSIWLVLLSHWRENLQILQKNISCWNVC